MAKKKFPPFVILALISLAAALVLALTNMVTAGPIEEHRMAALQEAYNSVLPAASYEPVSYDTSAYKNVTGLYKALDENGNIVGYCVTARQQGYAGPVAVTFGLDPQGTVVGTHIGDTDFLETNGIGARALEPSFAEQFTGLSPAGGSFEALSGATFTSNAVLGATNGALSAFAQTVLETEAEPIVFGKKAAAETASVDPSALVPGAVLAGSAQGFGGDVQVEVTLGDDLSIASLAVDAATETEGLGKRAMESAFTDQFIGQSIPVSADAIDALSGATITTNAVIDAINTASPKTAEILPGATLKGSAQGFAGAVDVTVVLDDACQIASLSVSAPDETEGLGKRTMEDDFTAQFVGKSLDVTLDDIEAVSGATITSTAVIDAIHAAVPAETGAALSVEVLETTEEGSLGKLSDGQALVSAGENYSGTLSGTFTFENGQLVTGSLTVPGQTAEETPDADALYSDALTASAAGFGGEVTVKAVLDGNTITSLAIEAPSETEGLGKKAEEPEFAAQFVGKTLPLALSDIDAIAGATITSTAVVDALNSLGTAVEPAAVEEPVEAPAEETADALTASAAGFGGDVTVKAVLDGNTITSLAIEAPSETEGLGKKAEEPEFAAQFVGKTLPLTLSDMDAIAGATITSTAVVDALNALAAEEPAVTEEPVEAPAPETVAEAAPAPVREIPVVSGEDLTCTLSGFGGDVTVTASLDQNTITALSVKAPAETTDLGKRAEDAAFTEQFIGKTLPLTVEDIDAIAGATITTTTVVNALNTLVLGEEDHGIKVLENPEPISSLSVMPVLEGAVSASAPGFGGDVTVLAVLENNTIAQMAVYAPAETTGLGRLAEDSTFTEQFIGKTLPIASEDIEAISGATITTQAVVDALNQMVPVEKTYTAKGYGGDVTVTVSVMDQTIKALSVSAPNETEGLGKKAEEEAFVQQFIGKTLPIAPSDIEAISGATVTTTAVLDALNTVIVPGFGGDITVQATLDNGVISRLSISAPAETAGLGKLAEEEAFTRQFIGMTLPVDADSVEAISGATITTQAVIDALNSLR